MGKKRNSKTSGIHLEFKGVEGGKTTPSAAAKPPPPPHGVAPLATEIKQKEANEDSSKRNTPSPSEENEEESFKTLVEDWVKRQEEKKNIREFNMSPNYEEFEALLASKKLDSNLKRCTGFVRKLRQYVESQKEYIEKELSALNLTKYLSEIADALVEVRVKISDVNDLVYICTLIHQKYTDFNGLLLENYKKVFPTKKTELNSAILSKLNLDLRVFGELILQGILPLKESTSLLVDMFRSLLSSDKEELQCIVVLINFLKGVGKDILGIIPRNIRRLCEKNGADLPNIQILAPERKKMMSIVLKEYYNAAEKSLVKRHEKVLDSETTNRKFLKTKGEIPGDRLTAHQEMVVSLDKFHEHVKKLANLLDEDVPELRVLPPDPEQDEEMALLAAEAGDSELVIPGILIFEDEETRSFYQDFPDLKVYLPPVAYRDNLLQAAEEEKAIADREKEAQNIDMDEEVALLQEEDGKHGEEEDVEETDEPPSEQAEEKESEIKPNFQMYLNSLLNCVNRNMVDRAAIEFAENFNNKPNRKKLVKSLFQVPRQRLDLLPLYARLVAILSPVMPDVGIELSTMLKNDFRYLVRKKDQIFIETKLKITRFIGELVNFGIFPRADAFTCFKILLIYFIHHQIEMACAFVETCGRYLYKSPASHRRMKIYLEEMMRKKTVKSLEPRYVSLIDHAYFIVCPPEGGIRSTVKKRHILDLFFRSLISGINKTNAVDKLKLLRSLNWDNPQIKYYAIRAFSSPWEYNSHNYSVIMSVLSGLGNFYSELTVAVADNIIDDFRNGLESTHTRNNHRRMSVINYLGELYNYKLINGSTFFNVLYDLINIRTDFTEIENVSSDPPSNLFRIRLVCFLLSVSGDFFLYGTKKKKLLLFIKFFQRYYWNKRESEYWKKNAFPHAIQEKFEDILKHLFPKVKFAGDLEEANKPLESIEEPVTTKLKSKFRAAKESMLAKLAELPTIDEAQEAQEYSEFREDGEYEELDLRHGGSFESYYQMQGGGSGSPNFGAPAWNHQPRFVPINNGGGGGEGEVEEFEEDEEFLRNLDRMCSEGNPRGKAIKTDIAIPLQIRSSSAFVTPTPQEKKEGGGDENTIGFVLIQRKGNKQQYKNIHIPAETDFVKNMRSREEAEKAEKERMKRITLGINKLQMAEEREEEFKKLQNIFTTK